MARESCSRYTSASHAPASIAASATLVIMRLNLRDITGRTGTAPKVSSSQSGLLHVRGTPALAGHLLPREDRAGAPCVGGLALIKRAVRTVLSGHVFRELRLVHLGCVVLVAEALRLRVFLVQPGGLRGGPAGTACDRGRHHRERTRFQEIATADTDTVLLHLAGLHTVEIKLPAAPSYIM